MELLVLEQENIPKSKIIKVQPLQKFLQILYPSQGQCLAYRSTTI
jgi:hypothetical protein